jgi:hypothetical protein
MKDGSFIVLDKLAKKRRIYHVPYLIHAELMQQAVYIFTSNSKIMQLNLLTATRQFLSADQLKCLTQVKKTYKSLHTKNTTENKLKHSLINIESSPKFAFSNTINSF